MASIITPSTQYNDNYSNKVYANKLIGYDITDGTATFSDGTITGLVFPTNPQDAVTKAVVDGISEVAPPVNSVQFNDLIFGGSSNLTFIPNTLTVNGPIKDGSGITINTNGIISGINNPVLSNQIASKSYVDSFNSSTANNYIASDIGVTYTAAQMINAIVYRNLATDNDYNITVTDTTPSAAQIIAYIPNATVGYTAKFKIFNDSLNANGTTIEGRDGFIVKLNPGAGVTFYPNNSFNINRGYALDAYIMITNVVTPAVTIMINRCMFSGLNVNTVALPTNTGIIFTNVTDYLNYNSMKISGSFLWNNPSNVITDNNYSYTTNDIKNQLIIRNPSAVSADIFGFNINPRYLNQITTIQNISAHTITITGQTNIWSLTTSISIPAGNQAVISLTRTNPTISNAGSYYNLGSYNTTGGTGTGLTVVVNGITTSSTLLAGGAGYTQYTAYTTYNITNPSATGLTIYCDSVDGMTGAITSYLSIVNFVSGGYQNGDILKINGGDGNAQIRLDYVNCIGSLYVNNLGNGQYVSTDVLNISGGTGGQITLGSFMTVMKIGNYAI